MKETKIDSLVPDTSVIIEGISSDKINRGEFIVGRVIIHEAVVSELEHQANQNKAIGFLGLDELERLKKLSIELKFSLEFLGRKPTAAEIRHSDLGEIDSMIRDLAFDQDGTLFTADKVQSRVADAKGIKNIYVKPVTTSKPIALEKYFDATTMSVHLRENIEAKAKRGKPGAWTFDQVSEKPLLREEIQDISREIIENAGMRRDGFIEIERPGSTIVQLGSFRIVITKPPFSDGWEITAVRPVKKMTFEEYNISEKLKGRITEQAEGILIAGSPGMGKSTFAQTLAEFYASKGKIVKTIEAPRDMVLPDTITQYAISHGDAQEVHDVLLLSRPDYSVFDEMRNTKDFELYADLRLAGIGLAGVVHAKNPIDAIQRFVGRIELGVIPQVVDTVIFIKDGQIGKVLSVAMTVKVPSGMTEEDLARPVVVITDFETKKAEYELYSYGEETVCIPVKGQAEKKPTHDLAAKQMEKELQKYVSRARVELVSDRKAIVYVPESEIGRVIGTGGSTINKIEEEFGLSLDVQAENKSTTTGGGLEFKSKIGKKHVVLEVNQQYANKMVSIYVDNDYLMSAFVGKDGVIKVTSKHKIGKVLEDAIHDGDQIKLVIGGK